MHACERDERLCLWEMYVYERCKPVRDICLTDARLRETHTYKRHMPVGDTCPWGDARL